MDGFYQSQANVMIPGYNIYKGQSVTREFFEALPEKVKIKFIFISGLQVPIGLNEIIGDNPKEKAKREKLSKEQSIEKHNKKDNQCSLPFSK